MKRMIIGNYKGKYIKMRKVIKENHNGLTNREVHQLRDLYDSVDLPANLEEEFAVSIVALEYADSIASVNRAVKMLDDTADDLVNEGFEDEAEEIWDIIALLRQGNIEESKKPNKKVIRENLFIDDKFPMIVSLDTIKPTVTSYPELSVIEFLDKVVHVDDHNPQACGEGREVSYSWDEFEDPANDSSKPTRTYKVIAFPTEESYETYLEDSAETDSEVQKKVVDAVENKIFYEAKKVRKMIRKMSIKEAKAYKAGYAKGLREAKKALKEDEVELNDYTKEMIEEMVKDDYSMNHKASASEVIDWIYKDEDISSTLARKVYNYYCDVYSELQPHSEEDDYFDDEYEETDDPLYGYRGDDE